MNLKSLGESFFIFDNHPIHFYPSLCYAARFAVSLPVSLCIVSSLSFHFQVSSSLSFDFFLCIVASFLFSSVSFSLSLSRAWWSRCLGWKAHPQTWQGLVFGDNSVSLFWCLLLLLAYFSSFPFIWLYVLLHFSLRSSSPWVPASLFPRLSLSGGRSSISMSLLSSFCCLSVSFFPFFVSSFVPSSCSVSLHRTLFASHLLVSMSLSSHLPVLLSNPWAWEAAKRLLDAVSMFIDNIETIMPLHVLQHSCDLPSIQSVHPKSQTNKT